MTFLSTTAILLIATTVIAIVILKVFDPEVEAFKALFRQNIMDKTPKFMGGKAVIA